MKRDFQSLKWIGWVVTVISMVIILAVTWWTTVSQTRGEVWRIAEDHAQVLTSALVIQLENLGPTATKEQRRDVFQQLRWDGQVVAALILNSKARSILVSRDAGLASALYDSTPLARLIPAELVERTSRNNSYEAIRHNQYVACIQPVLLNEPPAKAQPDDYGRVMVIFDIGKTLDRARAGFWVVSLTTIAVVLLVAILVNRIVFERLSRINKAARAIAAGDFSTEIRFPGRDEIAQLSNALNQVAAWVENSTKALRESEQSYRELVESSNDLIWSADAEGRWTFVNRTAAAKIYGRKAEELIGKRISSFATEETEIDNVITFEQIDKGQGHLHLDTIHLRKDGTPVFLNFNGLVQRDSTGQLLGLNGIATDTTARRKSEERIREQASLIDLAGDAIFVRDLQDKVLFWNRSCEQLFGWTKEEAMGQRSTQLAFRDLKAVGEAQEAVVDSGEWAGELRPVHKEGREIIVSSRWTLVRDAENQPKSILCINTDITDKKQLEAQFLRIQRLEGIGTLASGIAHDLNNVFSPITISLALLKDKITDPAAHRMVSVLGTSTKRGADIVKQLLTFARGTEGKMGLLQPAHIIKELVNIINGTFPKAVHTEFNIAKNLWPVIGDATRLHQVLLNLCINSRDAMPDGGVLTIHASNVEIDSHFVRLQPDAKPGPHVVIEITDTGTGIPQEYLQRIFDPFFTTKEPGKGTGLGLSSALGIVRSHGGFISVKSARGIGTTFKVHLPAQPSEQGQTGEQAATPPPRGNGETILFVEDEDIVRMATVATLESKGYKVLTACNGLEGTAVFRENESKIDLVLTDMMMPKQDGVGFIKSLREMNLRVPVVISTGMDSELAMEKFAQYGVSGILEKPYTGDQMIRRIQRAINESADTFDSDGSSI